MNSKKSKIVKKYFTKNLKWSYQSFAPEWNEITGTTGFEIWAWTTSQLCTHCPQHCFSLFRVKRWAKVREKVTIVKRKITGIGLSTNFLRTRKFTVVGLLFITSLVLLLSIYSIASIVKYSFLLTHIHLLLSIYFIPSTSFHLLYYSFTLISFHLLISTTFMSSYSLLSTPFPVFLSPYSFPRIPFLPILSTFMPSTPFHPYRISCQSFPPTPFPVLLLLTSLSCPTLSPFFLLIYSYNFISVPPFQFITLSPF